MITKERILYLLKGADQEMCHGDYLPTIPERIELCTLALKALEAAKVERISDNDITKAAEEIHSIERFQYAFIHGAQWYREHIKNVEE